MTVCIIDTSIFCNVLDIPGKNQHRDEIRELIIDHQRARWSLLLPMAAIIETGNHIGHLGKRDGMQGRRYGERFANQVRAACNGDAPWVPTQFPDLGTVREWLDEFPDHSMRGLGIGDASIVGEWKRLCRLHPFRRVLIWSLDSDLACHDRTP